MEGQLPPGQTCGFQLQTEVSKIQKWRVATQMDLDAKENQVRQLQSLLQEQGSELQEEQRRYRQLQNKFHSKSKEADKLQEDLAHQISARQIMEEGMKMLDGKLKSQEEFVNIIRDLNAQRKMHLRSLNDRLDVLQKKLEDENADKNKENEQLRHDVAELKADLVDTLNRLSIQTQECEELNKTLEETQRCLDENAARVRYLEDTIDSKDRDIDIMKDHNDKQMNALLSETRDLAADLSVAERHKEELNAELVKTSKEKVEARELYSQEIETAEVLLEEVCQESESAMAQVKELRQELLAKSNLVSKIREEKDNAVACATDRASKLETELEDKRITNEKVEKDLEILQQKNISLENELKEIKKVHNDLKVLRVQYEKALDEIHNRDAEIRNLRLIQVQKLDQDEDMAKLRRERLDFEENLLQSQKEMAILQKDLADRDASIKNLEKSLSDKSDDLEKFRGEALDLAQCVEKRYKEYLEIAKKDKIEAVKDLKSANEALEAQLSETKITLVKVEKELSDLKANPSIDDITKDTSDKKGSDKPSPSRRFPEFDIALSSSPEIETTSRNKRKLEDDFETFLKKAESKPKTYVPKRKRMFFKSKSGTR